MIETKMSQNKPESSKAGTSTFTQKYCRTWELEPHLKGWLRPVEGNPHRAYCATCFCELQAKKKDLCDHAKTQKHIKRSRHLRLSRSLDSSSPEKSRKRNFDFDRPKYPQRYCEKWESDPELEGWLNPVEGSPFQAFCAVCHCMLQSRKKDLIVHARSKKHKTRVEKILSESGFDSISAFLQDNMKKEEQEMNVIQENQEEVDGIIVTFENNEENITDTVDENRHAPGEYESLNSLLDTSEVSIGNTESNVVQNRMDWLQDAEKSIHASLEENNQHFQITKPIDDNDIASNNNLTTLRTVQDDDSTLFCNILVNKLRKLSPPQREDCMLEIHKCICYFQTQLRAEQNDGAL